MGKNMLDPVLWKLHVHCSHDHTAVVTAYMRPKEIKKPETREEGTKDMIVGERLAGKMGLC